MNDEIPKVNGPVVLPENGIAPESAVILCHGYGSNGEDLISLARHWQGLLTKTIFLAPNAHENCPGSPLGYQWFPLSTLSKEERREGSYKAAPVLDNYIDRILDQYHLEANKLALVGFSQGTMMSLHVGLRRERELAGILGFSGALSAPENLVSEIKSKPPIFLIHGDRDNVIPPQNLFESVGALAAAGIVAEKHVSQQTAHNIAPDGLQKGGTFLAKLLV
ncbi:MAG: alpha/beta hydrolase [Sphingomonadales bacterium]